jgi:hypothetical protein
MYVLYIMLTFSIIMGKSNPAPKFARVKYGIPL